MEELLRKRSIVSYATSGLDWTGRVQRGLRGVVDGVKSITSRSAMKEMYVVGGVKRLEKVAQ
ncbi:hypothetical protein J6590_071696 [Homalodisca vitripennis]|nr:hypothetical protein J6590_071696 [Homalodisca vitripennis]